MKVLITGGAGFIGCNLARQALQRGWEVRILDNLATGYEANLLGLEVDFVKGSVLEEDALRRACDGVDAVIHLAALGSVPRSVADPVSSHHVNATGTLMVLEQARRAEVATVVVSSSSSVYGMNPALPKHEREWVRPMSPYAVTKLAAEQYTLAYQQSYGLQTLAFRFFNVFGPYQRAGHAYAAVIPSFVAAMLSARPIRIHGDGSTSRDFTYVGTVCRVLLEAVQRDITSTEPINLAFGSNTTLLALVDTLREITGLDPQVEFGPPRTGDVAHSRADSGRLRALFPDLTPVPLVEGLRHTVDWFRH
jgi:UDP-glucose 4-epimerase